MWNKERRKIKGQGLILFGALAGAAVGNANDTYSSSGTTIGALTGAAIAAEIGANQVDYSRIIAKFGPTQVVDRCMASRGYHILSNEGFGGG